MILLEMNLGDDRMGRFQLNLKQHVSPFYGFSTLTNLAHEENKMGPPHKSSILYPTFFVFF